MGERKKLVLRPTQGFRHRPMCNQCGRDLTGRTNRDQDADYVFHEVADDTLLRFRLFASSHDPEENGHVAVQCSSGGIAFGWWGVAWPGHHYTWPDLFAVLDAAKRAGILLAHGSFTERSEAPDAD